MSLAQSDQERLCMMNPLDHEEFRRQGHMIIDFIANYYRDIEKYPVRSQVEPGYLHKRIPENAPYNPEPIETILQDVQNHIVPGLTHWLSPYHFAYYPANASIAASLGEILCTGFNVDGFNWMASPAATELENIVMDWLGKMLELPESFLFSGNGGVSSREPLVMPSCAQSLPLEITKIAGIHPNNVRSVKTTKSKAFALSPDSLRSAIISDKEAGLIPLYLCATVGTTSSGAVDPVGPLCDVAEDYGIWVHIDAAYAGSACICPEFRHFIDGVECANSFSFNPHKWLLTNLDCCCLWVKDPSALVNAFSTDSEYLKNTATDSKQVVDYKDWQVPLTRRFRAIKLWLVASELWCRQPQKLPEASR
ncbi:Tyrosine/DOPA decarboxylase 2 [Vitis vinifera]|uniref:Tyrosine/DOPA decarboxylase 2 n=1 Tax=Vitis vinifera TaxID=29760 RepID=A0A438CKH1_VITVI|nr:Tyrosine/DOPA decarboxylase 2 [Vitis vinifera]